MLVRPARVFPGTAFVFRGSALAQIAPWLAALVAYASVVEYALMTGRLAQYTLTTTPFTLVGLALSIFLGFRNNACYDRWWEARKLWGAQINTARNAARLALNLVRGPDEDAEAVAAFHRRWVHGVIAYTHLLKLWLREHPERYEAELAGLLPEARIEALRGETNPPNAVAQWLGDRLMDAYANGWVHPQHLPALQGVLSRFLDIQGGCERIKKTPVPLSYTILTHRIVGLYCAALPFGIHDTVGPLTPVVVLIVAYAFLGLDAVGTQIEDPFEEDANDLPLDAICRTIERDLRQRLGESELPEPVRPSHGVLL